MAVAIDIDSCIACGACAEACPNDALEVDDYAEVDEDACIECGICVDTCPVEAISL